MARMFSALLTPGVGLMRRLRMSGKIAALGAMLLLPLALMLGSLYRGAHADAERTRQELQGAHQTQHLLELVFRTQAHRDLALRALAGDESAKSRRGDAAKALGQALAAVGVDAEAAASVDHPGDARGDWPTLRKGLQDLADAPGTSGLDELVARHAASVELLRGRILRVAEDSGLLLDPMADTYFLMDQVVVGSVPWLESLALLRDQGSGLLARGEAGPVERASMLAHADRVQAQVAEVDRRVASLQRAGVAEPAGWAAAKSASLGVASRARELFAAQAIAAPAAPFLEATGQALAAAQGLQTQFGARLIDRLEARELEQRRNLWLHMGVVAAGLGGLAYLGLAFYVSFAGALRTLLRGVRQVADGDLSHRIEIRGHCCPVKS
jgi:hypothetical protein